MAGRCFSGQLRARRWPLRRWRHRVIRVCIGRQLRFFTFLFCAQALLKPRHGPDCFDLVGLLIEALIVKNFFAAIALCICTGVLSAAKGWHNRRLSAAKGWHNRPVSKGPMFTRSRLQNKTWVLLNVLTQGA